MAKMDLIFSKLAQEIKKEQAEIETEEKEIVVVTEEQSKNNLLELKITELYNEEDFSYIDDIVDDEEIRIFLKENTLKILVQDNGNKLLLGKFLQDVFDKIGNSKNGEFSKWLIKTGIPERTALRYRNRYNLFKKLENKEARKNVLNMPNEMIEEIIRDSKTESEIILALEIGYSIEDIKETLVEIKNKDIIEIPEKNKDYKEVNIDNLVYDVKTKWNDIPVKKKEKVESLFKKILKIIGE